VKYQDFFITLTGCPNGWDHSFFNEIGLEDLVKAHNSKLGMLFKGLSQLIVRFNLVA